MYRSREIFDKCKFNFFLVCCVCVGGGGGGGEEGWVIIALFFSCGLMYTLATH